MLVINNKLGGGSNWDLFGAAPQTESRYWENAWNHSEHVNLDWDSHNVLPVYEAWMVYATFKL